MRRRSGIGSALEYAEIGERLRGARRSHGLSLRGLAERLGVSPSLISQVETGRARPSVSTLYAIASELGISLDELLFTDAPPGLADGLLAASADGTEPGAVLPADPVQRAGARKAIRLASGVIWERLTTASIPNIDFLYVIYEVGGASSPAREFQRHAGQEWGYILRGRLGVTIGFDEHVLGPGDAIAFDSTTPHRLHNVGDEPVHGIWFVLGRRPAQVAPSPPARAAAVPGLPLETPPRD
ncbi:MAG TPA: XRE family transcriptional regulator [Candidatus Limnocylindria bacterium]|nr:XRE family transcriptional regulator [Candidatus Limnocylindria bacterium]